MAGTEEYFERLRTRLLLDWDDPLFRGPRFVGEGGSARKALSDLASPRSAQALAWSAFRTFSRLPPSTWLSPLLHLPPDDGSAKVGLEFWATAPAPRARLLWLLDHLDTLSFHDPVRAPAASARLDRVARDRTSWEQRVHAGAVKGDGVFEEPIEIDLLVRTPDTLLVVTVLHQSDIATRTQWDPERDGLARGIDAAIDLAGGRRPAFLLLTDSYTRAGANGRAAAFERLLPRYRDDAGFLEERLPHRSARELDRIRGNVHWLSWADLTDLVLDHSAGLPLEHKRLLINLVHYFREKRLLHKGG